MAYQMARIPMTLSEFEGHLTKRVARYLCTASCLTWTTRRIINWFYICICTSHTVHDGTLFGGSENTSQHTGRPSSRFCHLLMTAW